MSPSLLLVAGLPPGARASAVGSDATMSLAERLDEVVVSTVRSAGVGGIQLVMPYDRVFAPLAAQVVLQYATPRYAEEAQLIRRKDGLPPPTLRFFDRKPKNRRRPAKRLEAWHELAGDTGVVGKEVHDLDEVFLSPGLAAAMIVGAGAEVGRILSLLRERLPRLPVLSLRTCSKIPARYHPRYVDDELEEALAGARAKRKPFVPEGDEGFPRSAEPAEADQVRSRWLPYALFVQRAIAELR